jgi:hypothetical protein
MSSSKYWDKLVRIWCSDVFNRSDFNKKYTLSFNRFRAYKQSNSNKNELIVIWRIVLHLKPNFKNQKTKKMKKVNFVIVVFTTMIMSGSSCCPDHDSPQSGSSPISLNLIINQ